MNNGFNQSPDFCFVVAVFFFFLYLARNKFLNLRCGFSPSLKICNSKVKDDQLIIIVFTCSFTLDVSNTYFIAGILG